MPDCYVLQGTFMGKDLVKDLFDFVKDCIPLKERGFTLYETSPQRGLTDQYQTLNQARLVPTCLLHFAWSDLRETRIGDGPFLDMIRLSEYIKDEDRRLLNGNG